jgi:hypothetical protein
MSAGCAQKTAGDKKEAVAAVKNLVHDSSAAHSEWTHDFGVVRPGVVLEWAYPIHNHSDVAWTVDKFAVQCRCTVPRVSSRVISPGKHESVMVRLDCGQEVADIIRAVTVHFKEAGVAPVVLVVKAAVRPGMTPSVREISFGGLARGETAERAITLLNYSDRDWRELRVEVCPEWAQVPIMSYRAPDARQAESLSEEPMASRMPRQVWSATVMFTGAGLSEGYCSAPLTLAADTSDKCRLYLSACVERPVRVVPDKLVFGPITRDESCERKARIIFRKQNAPDRVTVLGGAESLSVALRRVGERVWELAATLDAQPTAGAADGKIRLGFPGTTLSEVALPYLVFDRSGVE